MPELPEVTLYVESLDRLLSGQVLEGVRLRSPSLLRTWNPPLKEVHGRRVLGFRRLAKRVVWELGGSATEPTGPSFFLVFHLMVTGRFHWKKPGAAVPRKNAHAAFDFEHGTMLLTEAGRKKKATLHVVRGEEALAELDPGGIEPLEASLEEFRDALLRENRTLKRALTDPRILSGIGNAHSDEILLEAGLSPVQRTGNLDPDEVERLWRVTRESLRRWTELLREEAGDSFPEKITAFHPEMAAHGKFGEPCPRCGTPIQRIVYASRETNYCPTCQTGGRLLADRALSKLLKEDWPRSVEELEEMKEERRSALAEGEEEPGG